MISFFIGIYNDKRIYLRKAGDNQLTYKNSLAKISTENTSKEPESNFRLCVRILTRT
jgi:hypothetical protein